MAFALLKPIKHDVYPFIDPAQNLKEAAPGKTVLVTGAGTGIGRGIATSFAQAGASCLILAARRTEPWKRLKQASPNLRQNAKSLSPAALMSRTLHRWKRSISGFAAVADSDPESWCRTVDVDLKGPYYVARTYIRALRSTGKKLRGFIINVTSNNAWRYISGLSSYAAAKIGLNALSEYIDKEGVAEAASGDDRPEVRCVAMHPGGVYSEMVERGVAAGDMPEAIVPLLIDQPALPGGTAVYLSTERAEFLYGRFVSATWDMEELENLKERVVKEDLLRSRVLGVNV
ncbi:hypothetical protein BAUCODRAFT_131174 [Baudoinia panamericana UAMH 10762]|uniref:NAD(P)-binding protein n=1 Tax=Baudoinia panamericana (strain UAMH 10762) TaxID=717646 RepID=M2NBU1_BAUPA|nr:uncharacterized protein BAUCODRAFT_131174 [Baudoinia panamericana UAMH 10762]EMC96624.1 hypothetical protein BAUCODRAFT_131174 [Baudoinia panamericana UAMH 10762]